MDMDELAPERGRNLEPVRSRIGGERKPEEYTGARGENGLLVEGDKSRSFDGKKRFPSRIGARTRRSCPETGVKAEGFYSDLRT